MDVSVNEWNKCKWILYVKVCKKKKKRERYRFTQVKEYALECNLSG